MLTFEEFQEKAAQTADKRLYLSLEQQKECYKWYIEGIKTAADFITFKFNDYCNQIGCYDEDERCPAMVDALSDFKEKVEDMEYDTED